MSQGCQGVPRRLGMGRGPGGGGLKQSVSARGRS